MELQITKSYGIKTSLNKEKLIEELKSKRISPDFKKDENTIDLIINISCGCKKEYKNFEDISSKSEKCEHDNYFIYYEEDKN